MRSARSGTPRSSVTQKTGAIKKAISGWKPVVKVTPPSAEGPRPSASDRAMASV